MKDQMLIAINEMEVGDHEYVTFEEAKANHSLFELLDAWLRYEGIAGYTTKIIEAYQLLE